MSLTIFANKRYYEDEGLVDGFDLAVAAIEAYSKWKPVSYQLQYERKYEPGKYSQRYGEASPYMVLKEKSGLQCYWLDSISYEARATLSAQVEARKLKIQDDEARLEAVGSKMNATADALLKKAKVKASFVELSKTGEWRRPYPKCALKVANGAVSIPFMGVGPIPVEEYERKVDADLRRLKARQGQLKGKANALAAKIEREKSLPPKRAVFGGRAAYAKKDAPGADLAEWKAGFSQARTQAAVLPGRHTSAHGNFIAKLDRKTGTLTLVTPFVGDDGEPKTATFKNVGFPRLADRYDRAVARDGEAKPVMWTLRLRKDAKGRRYVVLSATFDGDDGRVLYDWRSTGIVASDVNQDHVAWVDLAADGRVLDWGTIPMNLKGLSSGEAEQVVRNAAAKLLGTCAAKKKPLAREALDFNKKKREMAYGDPKRNAQLSAFAYAAFLGACDSAAERLEIAIHEVDPAWTSFVSRLAFMKERGFSAHRGAAACVGLVAMDRDLVDLVPKRLVDALSRKNPKAASKPRSTLAAIAKAFKRVDAHSWLRGLPPERDGETLDSIAKAMKERRDADVARQRAMSFHSERASLL